MVTKESCDPCTFTLVTFLILCPLVCTAGSTNLTCNGFTGQPHDQYVPEGTNNETFFCRFPGALSVGWLINGIGTNELPSLPMTVVIDDQANTLTIGALREYNRTVVGCLATLPSLELCVINATLLIRAPPGPVDNLELHPSLAELILTWEHSVITMDYAIEFCIDVHQIVGEVRTLVRTECGINQSSYRFNTRNSEPDPDILYDFMVTPRYNVTGARNGTSRNIGGYFIAEPAVLAEGSMNVDVMILYNWQVYLTVTFHDAEAWITGGRKADRFNIEVVLNFRDESQPYTCLRVVEPVETMNSTVLLHPSCSGLPVQGIGSIKVTAINSAGSSNSLWAPLSTNFVQGIRTIPCDSSRCQFKIVYTVVADPEVAGGAFIMLHNGDDDIHYFVGGHAGNVHVNGLAGNHYNLTAFLLNQSGLPFESPANPQNEIINVQSYSTFRGDQRLVHLSRFDLSNRKCQFLSNSTASHCAIIVHTLDHVLGSYLFERRGDSAQGHIILEPGREGYVVAFAYTNGTIHGRPYKSGKIPQQMEGQGTPTVVIVVIALVIVLAVICAVTLVGWRCVCHQKKSNDARGDRYRQQVELDNQIQKLLAVSSMEELSEYSRLFNSDWKTIYNDLLKFKHQLAEKVYKECILPKEIEMQEQSDSGRYTLTTSTIDEEGGPVQPENNEGVVFGEALTVHNGNTPASLATELHTMEDDGAAERAVHKQDTEMNNDASSSYKEMIRDTLSTNPNRPYHSGNEDSDSTRVEIGGGPPIMSFHNPNAVN